MECRLFVIKASVRQKLHRWRWGQVNEGLRAGFRLNGMLHARLDGSLKKIRELA